MNSNKSIGIKKVLIAIIVILGVVLALLVFKKSFSSLLDDDVEVEANTTLIYYLDVSYDGVDRNGLTSSDTTVSLVNSGYLFVEDKIPAGLTFTGFVTTEDGSIGAVKRSDGTVCPGKVVDDTNDPSPTEGSWNAGNTEYTYHGLHYNANNRTVTFKVQNLKAGCKLTVGIITTTPATVDDPLTTPVEVRRDFYNFANAWEKDLTVNSNTVHAFMGSETATLYNVTYEYVGTVPTNAPPLPQAMSYADGANVLVAPNVILQGYTFSGWTTTNATITNGSFSMPSSNVVIKGSFTPITTNKVTYQITGTVPPGYIAPLEKSYYSGSTVDLDKLAVGDVFNGYRFLGWSSTNVTISPDSNFQMPASDVVITGNFEEAKYRVIYAFYDTVLPPSADSYLPTTKEYLPETNVTLEDVLGEPNGYKFLGWYKEDSFVMPAEDVIIYGEWMKQTGTFEPTITKEIVNDKGYYHYGDVIQYNVKVKNTASFPITDVLIRENTSGASFVAGSNYTLETPTIARIPTIDAGATIVVSAQYPVKETDTDKIINMVELIGALAANNYVLAEKEYLASVTANLQSKINICKLIDGVAVPNTFQFNITGINNQFDTWVTMLKDECKTFYVSPGSYKISEIVPQEYTIKTVTGSITSNGSTLVVAQGTDYEITYTNQFRRKGFFHSGGRVVNRIIGG